jgi:hypothetical protein
VSTTLSTAQCFSVAGIWHWRFWWVYMLLLVWNPRLQSGHLCFQLLAASRMSASVMEHLAWCSMIMPLVLLGLTSRAAMS